MYLVFAHKYAWRHMNRRKQLRKAAKEGIIQIVSKGKLGILYSVPDNFKVKKG